MRCKAINKQGQPCSIHPLKGESYCFVHSQSDRAKMARQKSDYFRHCVQSLNLVGRLRALQKEAKKVKNDKTIPTAEKAWITLSLFDSIEKLEKRIQNDEEATKAENNPII